jgi:uncharacterized membrane protein (UPF0127 family)
MNRKVLFFAAIAAFMAIAVGFILTRIGTSASPAGIGSPHPSVTIGGERVSVALAITDAQRQQGLSGTQPLKENEGMLFVFTDDGEHRFWMKDMNYAIDIIWIDADGRIVYIAPSLSPDTYPNSYGPDAPSRYVLEVSAGFASDHRIQVGDRVAL